MMMTTAEVKEPGKNPPSDTLTSFLSRSSTLVEAIPGRSELDNATSAFTTIVDSVDLRFLLRFSAAPFALSFFSFFAENNFGSSKAVFFDERGGKSD